MVFSLIILLLVSQSQAIAQNGFPSIIIASTNINTEPHPLPLKAIQEGNGQMSNMGEFKLDFTNVISTPIGSELVVFTSESVEKARIKTDIFLDLQSTGFNTFALNNISQGVYTLNVIVNGAGNTKAGYEGILVIGQVSQDIVQKEIFKTVKDGDEQENKDMVCLYNPAHSLCKPDKEDKCPAGWGKNEDGQCFPVNKKCPAGYWRADDDETGACVPRAVEASQDEEVLPPCDGSFQDCVTESGFVCEAGSTDDNCELDEDQPVDQALVESPEDQGVIGTDGDEGNDGDEGY